MRNKKRLLTLLGGTLLVLYVASYLVLSRQGYADADEYNIMGFYYFPPEDTDSWRRCNFACVYLFYPLNAVDRWTGFGRQPASEPMWRLRL